MDNFNFNESSTDYVSPGCLQSGDAEYNDQYDCSYSHRGVSPNGEPSLKSKKILKVCRHYSYNLICGAVEAGWEGHELANLIKLVSCQLDLDSSKLIKLLERTGTGTPDIVFQLMEQQQQGSSSTTVNCCSFSTPQLVAVFLSTAKNIEHFINLMEQAFEYDLFSLSSPDTLEVLHSFTVDAMDYRQTQRYARTICEHSGSKANCGRVLRQFSSSLPAREAPHFVFEVMSLDFFRDLTGSLQQFLRELGGVGEAVDGLISEAHDRDDDGEIVESDADSHGDLKDFIAPDDDESNELDADSEAGSLNENDDDGDDDDDSHAEEQREDLQLPTTTTTITTTSPTIIRRRRRKEEDFLSPHRGAAAAPLTKRRRLLSNSNRAQSPDSADEDVFHSA